MAILLQIQCVYNISQKFCRHSGKGYALCLTALCDRNRELPVLAVMAHLSCHSWLRCRQRCTNTYKCYMACWKCHKHLSPWSSMIIPGVRYDRNGSRVCVSDRHARSLACSALRSFRGRPGARLTCFWIAVVVVFAVKSENGAENHMLKSIGLSGCRSQQYVCVTVSPSRDWNVSRVPK